MTGGSRLDSSMTSPTISLQLGDWAGAGTKDGITTGSPVDLSLEMDTRVDVLSSVNDKRSTVCPKEKNQKKSSHIINTKSKAKSPSLRHSVANTRKIALTDVSPHVQEMAMKAHSRIVKMDSMAAMAGIAFEYWKVVHNHPNALFSEDRKRRILSRLREAGGTLEALDQVLYAIRGALHDDFLMGKHPRATRVFDGVETILRDRAQVERLSALIPEYRDRTSAHHPLVMDLLGAGNGQIHPAHQ